LKIFGGFPFEGTVLLIYIYIYIYLFIYLFIRSSEHVVSVAQSVNNELEWIRKERVVSQFQVISWNLSGGRESVEVKALCYKPGGRGFQTS
jgi:hypothetical protein